jgi:surface polysaccharide O-acyltransferase-like enzyme
MEKMETVNASNRIAFLDNIHSLIIILVLIFHSGASYGAGADFWPFHENNPSGIIDFFMFIGDVFLMAIIFFVAGYFVLPDFLKKGLGGFLKGKLKRLGLPWLIITTTALPAIDYIHYVPNHIKQSLPMMDFMEY